MEYSIINSSELVKSNRIDAEHFRPIFLDCENRVLSKNHIKFADLGKFITGPFGSQFKVKNYAKDSKYRYIRGKDVKPFILEDFDNVYIPKNDFLRLKNHSLEENDILISVVGTNGNASLIQKDTLPSIFSCKSISFRSEKINQLFLITYLNSFNGGYVGQSKQD